MHVSIAVATWTALSLAILLAAVNAHSNGLDSSTCANFNVAHRSDTREDTTKSINLELLKENEDTHEFEPVDCFIPSHSDYKIKLSSNSGVIKGFILQAITGSRLPPTNSYSRIPLNTAVGPCEQTVSHTRIRTSSSPDLVFPLSTRKSTRPLVFRYSVVFSMTSFLQDRYMEIPSCSSQVANVTNDTDTTPTSPTITTPEPLGKPVAGHCGKEVMNTVITKNDTHNNMSFDCTINKPLKGTNCTETCTLNGQQVVCQVQKSIKRRKGYMCTLSLDGDQAELANPEQYDYETTFDEMVTTGCQCYEPFS